MRFPASDLEQIHKFCEQTARELKDRFPAVDWKVLPIDVKKNLRDLDFGVVPGRFLIVTEGKNLGSFSDYAGVEVHGEDWLEMDDEGRGMFMQKVIKPMVAYIKNPPVNN